MTKTWAVILAGGDGKRLASLTEDHHGTVVPKQYCSLSGGRALWVDAVRRACYVAPRERTRMIVTEHHQRYWESAVSSLGSRHVLVQPRNCGTAVGILFAVLHILSQDARARIVFFPADHHIRDEETFGANLREAVALVTEPD
ncbi:MAG: sugar phosphate nucleotidyltransferase, partial [Gammaproteobacteria bacterium]